VSIRFADGSLGILIYGTTGAPTAGKEFVEGHREGRSGRIDDFRSLRLWGAGRGRTQRARGQDKGHANEIRRFASVVRGEASPPPVAGYVTSTAITFAALRSLENGIEMPVEVDGRRTTMKGGE